MNKLKELVLSKGGLGVLLLLIVGIGACCNGILTQPGTFLSGPNLGLVEKVVERHDAYVNATIEPEDAAKLEESHKVLTRFRESPTVATEWFRMYFEPVAARHDTWVTRDEALLDYQRTTYLRTTEFLRAFYDD